eukprot:m.7126 g.7126  ORF g.7126 m.7126 type:complete len:214 (-) comp5660_c0_seq1:3059-3700(-)
MSLLEMSVATMTSSPSSSTSLYSTLSGPPQQPNHPHLHHRHDLGHLPSSSSSSLHRDTTSSLQSSSSIDMDFSWRERDKEDGVDAAVSLLHPVADSSMVAINNYKDTNNNGCEQAQHVASCSKIKTSSNNRTSNSEERNGNDEMQTKQPTTASRVTTQIDRVALVMMASEQQTSDCDNGHNDTFSQSQLQSERKPQKKNEEENEQDEATPELK